MEASTPGGKEFGFERALAIINSQQQKSAQQIVELLYKGIRSYSKNLRQEDDITILTFVFSIIVFNLSTQSLLKLCM